MRLIVTLLSLLLCASTFQGAISSGHIDGGSAGGGSWANGTDSNIDVTGTEAPLLWCGDDGQDSGGVAGGGTLTCPWPGTVYGLAEDVLLTGSSFPLQHLHFSWNFGDDDQDWTSFGNPDHNPNTDQITPQASYAYHPEHNDFTDVVGSCDGTKDCAQYTVTLTINSTNGSQVVTWTVNVIDPYDTYSGVMRCYYTSGNQGTLPTGCTDGGIITDGKTAWDACDDGTAEWVRVREGSVLTGWASTWTGPSTQGCLISTYNGTDDSLVAAKANWVDQTTSAATTIDKERAAVNVFPLWVTGWKFTKTGAATNGSLWHKQSGFGFNAKRLMVSNTGGVGYCAFVSLTGSGISTDPATRIEDIFFHFNEWLDGGQESGCDLVTIGLRVAYSSFVGNYSRQHPTTNFNEHHGRLFFWDRQNHQGNRYENVNDTKGNKEMIAVRQESEVLQTLLSFAGNDLLQANGESIALAFVMIGQGNDTTHCNFFEDLFFQRNTFRSSGATTNNPDMFHAREGGADCATTGSNNGYIDRLLVGENVLHAENMGTGTITGLQRSQGSAGVSDDWFYSSNIIYLPSGLTADVGWAAPDAGVCEGHNNLTVRVSAAAGNDSVCGNNLTAEVVDANGNLSTVQSDPFDGTAGVPAGGAAFDINDYKIAPGNVTLGDAGSASMKPPADPDRFGNPRGADAVDIGVHEGNQ